MSRILLSVVILSAASAEALGRDAASDRLAGVWVVMKGPAPPGATIEYTRNGRITLKATIGGKDVEFTGRYSTDGKRIASKINYNGREKAESHVIRRLTADELHVVDEKGQVQECWRAEAVAAGKAPEDLPPRSRKRFSADALELLAEISNSYDLNGKRVPAGPLRVATMARLSRVGSREVQDLAEGAARLKWLGDLNKAQGTEVRRAFESRAQLWPALIVGQVIESVAAPDDQQADIRGATKILENLMSGGPQDAVNKAWTLACLGNGTSNALKEKIRSLARLDGRSDSAPAYALDVVVDARGNIEIINQTKYVLHNCVVITRLVPDRERVQSSAKQEDMFGQIALPLLGFSESTVSGSREASRLRHNFHLQEKGVMVYVPELTPGGTITAPLASPAYYAVAKSADMSLWCDEWAVERQTARNWEELKNPPRTPTRKR